ncbi:MAG: DUF4192 domain-containing protein [Propionibacteriaceae bacterium]|jgi:hypothetical protein|nr:DUF4192 domain-containing protein [Propionibacteriaceae bacterium]
MGKPSGFRALNHPITSAEGMVAHIPDMVGLKPEECLVTAVTRQNMVMVTSRVDLDDIFGDRHYLPSLLDRIQKRFPGATLFNVAVSANPELPPAVAALIQEAFSGQSRNLTLGGFAQAANSSFDGCGKPSRAELAKQFAPPSEEQRETCADLMRAARRRIDLVDRGQWPERAQDLITEDLQLSDADLAELVILMGSRPCKEHLLVRLHTGNAEEYQYQILRALEITPQPMRENVLTMLAFASWTNSGGPITSMAIQALRDEFPGAAELPLLQQLIKEITPPSEWDDVKRMEVWFADETKTVSKFDQIPERHNTTNPPQQEELPQAPAPKGPAI